MSLCYTNRLKWLVFCAILVVVASSSSSSRRRPSRRLFPFHHARQENDNHDISDFEPTLETEKPVWKDKAIQDDEDDDEEEEVPTTDKQDEEHEDDDNHDTLHHSHHHHVSLLQVSCLLQVATSPSNTIHSYKQHAVTTIVDTGAQVTVLSFQAAQACGISHLIDLRYTGQATGVGKCRVVGRIPAGALVLQFGKLSLPSPAITVLEEDDLDVHLLLGLDFLRDYNAILSLEQECMILTFKDEAEPRVIPFLKPSLQQDYNQDDISAVGWINKDILASLGSSSTKHYDDSDNDDDGHDDYDDLDMSGV